MTQIDEILDDSASERSVRLNFIPNLRRFPSLQAARATGRMELAS